MSKLLIVAILASFLASFVSVAQPAQAVQVFTYECVTKEDSVFGPAGFSVMRIELYLDEDGDEKLNKEIIKDNVKDVDQFAKEVAKAYDLKVMCGEVL